MSPNSRKSSRRMTGALLHVIELLESRVQLDASYVAILPTAFSQNWSDTSLISTDDNWSQVPGVLGYQGNTTVTTSDIDPETITEERLAPVQVAANNTDPTAATVTQGVAEFELANPVVAIKGGKPNSTTGASPFLLFLVDTTGTTAVQVSYNLRDIDASSANALSQVALQYRVGTSGPFVNVPAGYVHDATTGPNLATLLTPVSATLPPAAANQSQVQIRIITSNANGADEWIGVDDIHIGQAGPGSLAFSSPQYTVNEADGTATITVARTGGDSGAVSVQYSATVGSADAEDFTPASGTLDFADGQGSATFPVAITNDTTYEPAETVNLSLTSPTGGATLGAPSAATLTIYDNDGTPPTGILVNEVDINPPTGSDNPYEYIELRGPAGTNLDNVHVLSVEGDLADGPGSLDCSFDLTGYTIGSNGLLIIKSSIGGFTPDLATTVVTDTIFDNSAALENNAESYVVVYSQTPLPKDSDLDPEDDGVLNLPSGASMLDGIGVKESGINGIIYAPGVVQTSGTPDALTRFANDTTPMSSAAWYGADLVNNLGNASVTYDTTKASANIPANAVLTPGAPNFGTHDITPPTLDATAFDFDAPAQEIALDFSESVLASFTADDFTLVNLTDANTRVPAANIDISETTGDVILLKFKNYPGNALPDGRYQLTLLHAGITDAAGNSLAADQTINLFSFSADANHDAVVNALDFNALASNFGKPGQTFGDGDFNYDGTVDTEDFQMLAMKFGARLGTAADALGARNGGDLFAASNPIAGDSFVYRFLASSGDQAASELV